MKTKNQLGFLSARNYIKEKREIENNILFLKLKNNFIPRINKELKKKISIRNLIQNLYPEKKMKYINSNDAKSMRNNIKNVHLEEKKDKTKFDILLKDSFSKTIFHNEFINNQYILHKTNDSINNSYYKNKTTLSSNKPTIVQMHHKRRTNSVDNVCKIMNKSTNTGFSDFKNAYFLVYNNELNIIKKTNSINNYINNFKNKNLKNAKKTNNIKNKYLRYIENNLLKNRANYILNNISPNRGGKESLRKLYNPMAI